VQLCLRTVQQVVITFLVGAVGRMVGRGGEVSSRAPTEQRVYLVAVRCGAYLQYIRCGAVLGAVAVAAAAIAADRSGVVSLAPKLCHWVGRGTTSV